VCSYQGPHHALLRRSYRQPSQPLRQNMRLCIFGVLLPVQPGYGLHHHLLQLQAVVLATL
jgi:hypothetical protein